MDAVHEELCQGAVVLAEGGCLGVEGPAERACYEEVRYGGGAEPGDEGPLLREKRLGLGLGPVSENIAQLNSTYAVGSNVEKAVEFGEGDNAGDCSIIDSIAPLDSGSYRHRGSQSLTNTKNKLSNSKRLNSNSERPRSVIDSKRAVGEIRLDDEREDRYDAYLEVE